MPILKTKVSYDKLIAKLNAFFKDIGKNEKLLTDIGNFSLERIRGMVRSGYSLTGDKKTKLAGLSESYKDMRRGAVKFRTINGKKVAFDEADERLNTVDTSFFRPDLSNLTFTGQMMKALGFTKQKEKRQVTIAVENSGRSDSNLTNKQVYDFVTTEGKHKKNESGKFGIRPARPFLGLDETGVARVKALVKTFIRKEIIKQRLRKR